MFLAKNAIKADWTRQWYWGPVLGYPKNQIARDAYVRCFVCRRDVKVSSRGKTSFAEHCRVAHHHRPDCLLRIQQRLPLRSRTGSLLDGEEAVWQRYLLDGMPVTVFETCPDLTVDEVEEEEKKKEEESSSDSLSDEKSENDQIEDEQQRLRGRLDVIYDVGDEVVRTRKEVNANTLLSQAVFQYS